MRKKIVVLAFLLSGFSFIGCTNKTDLAKVSVELGESSKFSSEEIESAIECVSNNFDFDGATLTKLFYDEKTSEKLAQSYLRTEKGKECGVGKENIIAILSSINLDGGSGVNISYADYNWILIRDNSGEKWRVVDNGY